MSAPSELSEHAAALYRGPLAEFTAARNRLAAELKVRDKALAAEVKALAKPSVSAWAVDQLFWHEEPRFAAFLAATAAVRDVLRTGAGPSERHVAARRHRDAHADLLARAQTILTDAGHGVAPTLLRRIGTTLEAVAARGWPELGPGCLAEDLDPPGFDDTFALGDLAPREAAPEPAAEPAPVRPSKRDAALAAAREDAARTARELDARRAESDDADAKAREAADAHDALEHELRELQRKVDRAASSRARAQATADGQRERLEAASEDHERATTKLRALED